MKIKSEKLLSSRIVVTGPKFVEAVASHQFTVYIGIFNAAPFLGRLLQDIEAQTIKDFPLIVVDNYSSDDSWNEILKWPARVRDRAKLIRNPINLGGTGSFSLNTVDVKTEWVITMHQDDTYLPNHVNSLAQAMPISSERDLVLFTDMGTQNIQGKRLFTPIRQSWIANLESNQSAFLANLVQQSVSYPSAAFRTNAIVPINIAWHSSSFPDTEITLLQASKGNFRFIPELTMLYRMNPNSESHDLNPKERVLGPFASLCRVMASDSFLSLCGDVPEKDRASFAKSVLDGIDLRLGESSFSEIVKLIASETMGMAWDYSDGISRDQIIKTYRLAEDGRTTKLLEELGVLFDGSNGSPAPLGTNEITEAQINLVRLLDEAVPPSNAQGSEAQKSFLRLIGALLPLKFRRKFIAFLVRIYVRFDPQSPWNLSWKPNN
jgi:hypothetical protein